MTYDQYNDFCRSLPAATYVMQWGNAHVWKVGGKVFAIGGWNKESGNPAYSFKVSEMDFHILKQEPGYRPAPYLASRGMTWIQQFGEYQTAKTDIRFYLKESYRIVSLGLTKKKQKELGLNQS